MNKQRFLTYLLLMLSLFLLIGCGGSETPEGTTQDDQSKVSTDESADSSDSSDSSDSDLRPVKLAMGYIPNVQFAPFYVAMDKGYFAKEGIELTLDYGMENDLVELVAANELQFAIASGDQVLLGRASERPIRYVANWYRRFPVAVTSIKHQINDPKALEGLKVGLPGLFGASYVGWLALVQAAGIDADSIELEAIGFNQVPVLVEGQVDAVVVYATNEPLLLQNEGYDVSTIYVADLIDLVANGLITNEETIQNDPKLVQGMVNAILHGISDVINDPDEAFEIVRADKWGTGIDDDNAETQRAVLQASLDFWHNEKLGVVPASAWQTSHDFMLKSGLLSSPISVDDAYTNEFASQANIE